MSDQKRIFIFMVWCLFMVGACQLSGRAVEGNQPEPANEEQEEVPDKAPEGDSTSPLTLEGLLGENWRHTGRKTELEMLIEEGKVVLEGITVTSPDEDFTGEIMTIRLTNPTDASIEVVIQPGQVLLPVFPEISMQPGSGVLAILPPVSRDQQGDWNPMPDFPRMSNFEFLKWWGEMPEDFEPTDEQWDEWTNEWDIRYGIDPDNIPNPSKLEIPPVPLVQETMIITTTVWKATSMTDCKRCSSVPMIAAQNEPILIQPGETVEIEPFVACIDAGVDAPPQGYEYILGGLASENLTNFAQCLSENDFQQETGEMAVMNIQAAIWYLSDGQMGLDTISDVLTSLGLDEEQMGMMSDLFGPTPSEWLQGCGLEMEIAD